MPQFGECSMARVSRRTGCNIETIRYYERIGLLPAPRRTESGYRRFDETHVARLSFIRHARHLGFSLDDIRALLALERGDGRSCARARDLAAAHLADVRSKIRHLRAMERVLSETIRRCARAKQVKCPIIETISAGPTVRPPARGGPN